MKLSKSNYFEVNTKDFLKYQVRIPGDRTQDDRIYTSDSVFDCFKFLEFMEKMKFTAYGPFKTDPLT